MKNEELDKILASVEKQIGDFRRKLRNSKSLESDTTIIEQIASLFEKLVEAISGEDADLEEKRRIYQNIVDFLKQRRSKRGADEIYLSAAYLLCNETDKRLTNGTDNSEVVQKITDWAKENIIAIKVYYETKADDKVIFRTEIFSRGLESRDPPSRNKWESGGDFSDLPSKVREEFIRTKKNTLDYMWYPDHSGDSN